jgi:hypothetical protein
MNKDGSQISQNFEFFELLSDFLKKNQFIYKNPLSDAEVRAIKLKPGQYHEYIE